MSKLQTQENLTPVEMGKQIVKMEQLKRELDYKLKTMKDNLLHIMQDTDVLSIKTGSYTLSRKTYRRVKVVDDELAAKDLKARGVPVTTKVVLDMSQMNIPLTELLVKQRETIDGVELTETEYVSMLMKKEKDDK